MSQVAGQVDQKAVKAVSVEEKRALYEKITAIAEQRIRDCLQKSLECSQKSYEGSASYYKSSADGSLAMWLDLILAFGLLDFGADYSRLSSLARGEGL